MKPRPPAALSKFLAMMLTGVAARAELPTYSVTPVSSFFPALGPVGDPGFPNQTFVTGVSAGGNNFQALYLDTVNPVDGLDDRETNFIVSAQDLSVKLMAGPPEGYGTGTSAAVFSSSAGHLVFSVSQDRGTPGWLDRIQVALANPNGTIQLLAGQTGLEQRGVNALGQVIAVGPNDSSAWLYGSGTGWKNLGSLGPSGYAQPKGINDTGVVVGLTANALGDTVPFLYREGVGMAAITDGGGNTIYGGAQAISNNGLVTGTANGRAFYFNSNTLEFNYVTAASNGIHAIDINDAGAILGISGSGDSAFVTLWTTENGLVSLSSLLAGNEDPFHPEWLMVDAVDINDSGWVLGTAKRVEDGSYFQVLLRPVPEPGMFGLVLGAAALLIRRRRREAGDG